MIIKKTKYVPFDYSEWHAVFCLLPRRVNDNELVWLQKAERQQRFSEMKETRFNPLGLYWAYRKIYES